MKSARWFWITLALIVVAGLGATRLFLDNVQMQGSLYAVGQLSAAGQTNRGLLSADALGTDSNGKEIQATAIQMLHIAQPGPILTNGETLATTFSNNVGADATHYVTGPASHSTITNTGLTGADAIATDANGHEIPATAIQMLHIAQPGPILTNGETLVTTFSNNVGADATHFVTGPASHSTITNTGLTGADAVATDANGHEIPATAILMTHIAQPGPILTNGEVLVTTFSNNVGADATHFVTGPASHSTITNSGLTGADAVATDANGHEIPATAILMTHIAQPGPILTNNYASGNPVILLSNSVKIDVAHSLSLSNIAPSRLIASAADDTLAGLIIGSGLSSDGTTLTATGGGGGGGTGLPATNAIIGVGDQFKSNAIAISSGGVVISNATGFIQTTGGGIWWTNNKSGNWGTVTNDSVYLSNYLTGITITLSNGVITLTNTTAAGIYAQYGLSNAVMSTAVNGGFNWYAADGVTLIAAVTNGGAWFSNPVSASGYTNSGLLGADAVATDSNGKQIQALAIQMTHIAQPGPILTNNYASGNPSILLSNSVALDIAHYLSLSNLTASRVLMSGPDKTVTNASATGAVPIDADGTATTLAQINALGTVAAATTATYVTGNSVPLTNDIFANRIYETTNYFPVVAGAINVDWRYAWQGIVTNANFTIAGFINASNSVVNGVLVSVSNSAAAAITVTLPAGLRDFGTNATTSVVVGAGKVTKMTFSLDPQGTNFVGSAQVN